MKRTNNVTDMTRQRQPLCGQLCQLGALAAAAAIAAAWWLAPVSTELDEVELLSAIALLGFAVVLTGMAADHLAGSAAVSDHGPLSLRRLVPAALFGLGASRNTNGDVGQAFQPDEAAALPKRQAKKVRP